MLGVCEGGRVEKRCCEYNIEVILILIVKVPPVLAISENWS